MVSTSRDGAFVYDSPWIRRAPQPAATARLICFPFAAGGASIFRSLAQRMPYSVEVVALQLPGREDRSSEDPPQDLDRLVRACSVVLRPYCTMPHAFYGHCAGALLAFEVVQMIGRRYGSWPLVLVAGAQPAPDLHRAETDLQAMSDAELVAMIRRRGGLPEQVAENPAMVDHLLPLLRSDFRLWEEYRYRPNAPLPCPIVVLRGRDDEVATPETTGPWRDHTSSEFSEVEVNGGHYFITQLPDVFAGELSRVVLNEIELRG